MSPIASLHEDHLCSWSAEVLFENAQRRGQFRCRGKAALRFPGETTMTHRDHACRDVPAQGIQRLRLA
jgi:hypothetical protein